MTIRVLGLGGSTRPDSSSEKALRVAAAAAAAAGAEVELLTGRELVLPLYDPAVLERSAEAVVLVEKLTSADGLLVSSPGYHGSISGMIKNVLDYIEDLRDAERVYLDGLAVGCVAVAYGWQAAVSTLAQLRVTVHALRAWPTPMGAALNVAGGVFDGAGAITDDSARFQLEMVGQQVVEFARMRQALDASRPAAP